MDHVDADVVVGQRDQCLAQRLHRTLHVGLDHQVQHLLAIALAQGRHDVFHAAARGLHQARFTALGFALLRNVLGQTLVFNHDEVITGIRHAGQTQHLHRNRRARLVRLCAGFVEQGAHAAVLDTADQVIALLQRTLLHQHGGDRATALVQRGLDDHAGGATVGHGLQFQQFSLDRDRVQQVVDAQTGLGRDLDHLHVTTEIFGDDLLGEQLVLDAHRIGTGLVDLVDRHDQRHTRRTGVLDGFLGLRHDAVIGRHHQHHDVGQLGTAGTHGRKRRVARGIQEADHALRRFNVVRTDVLGDATGFARGNLGAADVIQQRGLAVVDVAHDGDHRRTCHRLALVATSQRQQRVFGVVGVGTDHVVAEFFGHQRGGVMVDGLGDGRHDAHLEQRLDHIAALDGQLLGQIGDGDGVADGDVTHDRRDRTFEPMGTTAAARLVAVTAAAVLHAPGRTTARVAVVAAAGTIGGRQMQLTGEAVATIVIALGARTVVVVVRVAIVRTRCRTGSRRCSRARVAGRCIGSSRLGRSRGRRCVLGRFSSGFGRLALGFGTFLGVDFFLTLAGDFFVARTVLLGQCALLVQIALAGFLQLAQDVGALLIRGHRLAAGVLHVGTLLAHFHVDGRLAAAGTDGHFLQLATVQGDLLGGFVGALDGLLGLAVRATKEAQELHLFGTGHDLVGTAELHAGFGKLYEQFIDRGVDQFGKLADGGLLRHSDPMIWLALPRNVRRQRGV